MHHKGTVPSGRWRCAIEFTFQGLHIGPLYIHWYGVLIVSGLLAGLVLAQREARRLGENPEHASNIALLGAVFGIIGARAYHVLDRNEWPYYAANSGKIFMVWEGGIGIYGAVTGAVFALVSYVWWVNRRAAQRGAPHLSTLRWLDIGAPALLLGQAIGRWGNYFNHELFGPPTDLPWGIFIPLEFRPSQYLAQTHFHPLFLYESLLSFAGVFALLWVARRYASRLRVGDIFLLYFVWYPAERFALEFLRTGNWKVGALPMAQVIGVIAVTAAVALMWRWRARAPMTTRCQDAQDAVPHGPSRNARRRSARRG
ncbi:MAG: prolipoprotein diacylglyceryl transferase [Chloroflexota bacterium]